MTNAINDAGPGRITFADVELARDGLKGAGVVEDV